MAAIRRETALRRPCISREGWRRLAAHAERALVRQLAREPTLRAEQIARTVASSLPHRLGAWLLARLDGLGWSDGTSLPFDVLDRSSCPADFRDDARAIVRLALFGPPGQGRPADAKERERLFQQVTAEIIREARDLKSLDLVATRVLRTADVNRDGQLLAMLQGFLADRRSQLASIEPPRTHPFETRSSPFESAAGIDGAQSPPNVQELRNALERIRHEFDDQLVRFDLPGAQLTLARMDTLQKRYPDVLSSAATEHARADLARVEQRRQELFAEIDALTVWATASAREGKHDEAAQALRRLSALHASRPLLLSDVRFNEIRDLIIRASHVHEHRIAAEALLARERAVIAELRALADSIRRFQELTRREPHGSPGYLQILAEYRLAVETIKSRDMEWLAALTLELDELMSDLHDPTHRADHQVSHFLDTVRDALAKLRRKVEPGRSAFEAG